MTSLSRCLIAVQAVNIETKEKLIISSLLQDQSSLNAASVVTPILLEMTSLRFHFRMKKKLRKKLTDAYKRIGSLHRNLGCGRIIFMRAPSKRFTSTATSAKKETGNIKE